MSGFARRVFLLMVLAIILLISLGQSFPTPDQGSVFANYLVKDANGDASPGKLEHEAADKDNKVDPENASEYFQNEPKKRDPARDDVGDFVSRERPNGGSGDLIQDSEHVKPEAQDEEDDNFQLGHLAEEQDPIDPDYYDDSDEWKGSLGKHDYDDDSEGHVGYDSSQAFEEDDEDYAFYSDETGQDEDGDDASYEGYDENNDDYVALDELVSNEVDNALAG